MFIPSEIVPIISACFCPKDSTALQAARENHHCITLKVKLLVEVNM